MSGDTRKEARRPSRPRDRKIDEAKSLLLERYFPEKGVEVFYGRQLEVALEKQFFHWITKRALNELGQEGAIRATAERVTDVDAHFYWPKRHRYPRRQVREIAELIREFSNPDFTRAVGHHAELLVDAALATTGFRVLKRDVRDFAGKVWTETGHNLDRVIERDGVLYGMEIKNQLGYIDQTEFEIKLRMLDHLGLKPLFVARMMPGNYVYSIYRAGGFGLIFESQLYPLLAGDLAKRVRDRLGLPVHCVRALPDTSMKRFLDWHERSVAGK